MSARSRCPGLGFCSVPRTGPTVVIAALGAVALLGCLAASASADSLNGRISFTSFRDAPASAVGGDIFTMDPDGADVVKLTDHPWYDHNRTGLQTASTLPIGGRLPAPVLSDSRCGRSARRALTSPS